MAPLIRTPTWVDLKLRLVCDMARSHMGENDPDRQLLATVAAIGSDLNDAAHRTEIAAHEAISSAEARAQTLEVLVISLIKWAKAIVAVLVVIVGMIGIDITTRWAAGVMVGPITITDFVTRCRAHIAASRDGGRVCNVEFQLREGVPR